MGSACFENGENWYSFVVSNGTESGLHYIAYSDVNTKDIVDFSSSGNRNITNKLQVFYNILQNKNCIMILGFKDSCRYS